jgi:predicted aspartyl protease
MKFSAIATLCALAVLGGKVAHAADPIAVTPYRIDPSGWIVADVTLNGEGPFGFIVDTGATRSIVFSSLASELGLTRAELPPHRVIGTSSSGLFPTYVIGELAIGPARISPLVTVTLENWRPDPGSPQGVIGLDFLARYRIVFDAVAREMRLYDPDELAPSGTSAWRTVALHRRDFGLDSGDLFVVEGWVDRTRTDFMLDLGAGATIVNSHAYKQRTDHRSRTTFSPPQPQTSSRVVDALEESSSAKRVYVRHIRTEDAIWRNLSIVVYDAAVFRELGQSEEPFGLFGSDLVAEHSFALDLANDALWIGEPLARRTQRRPSLEPGHFACPGPWHCR